MRHDYEPQELDFQWTLILVLEDGAIVERGRYEELVLRDGAFARLARAGEFVEMEAGSEEPADDESQILRAASA